MIADDVRARYEDAIKGCCDAWLLVLAAHQPMGRGRKQAWEAWERAKALLHSARFDLESAGLSATRESYRRGRDWHGTRRSRRMGADPGDIEED